MQHVQALNTFEDAVRQRHEEAKMEEEEEEGKEEEEPYGPMKSCFITSSLSSFKLESKDLDLASQVYVTVH